jgi:hypothetical protein
MILIIILAPSLFIKSDVYATIVAFHVYASAQFQLLIQYIQCDNGREFDNYKLDTFSSTHGILFLFSRPYTSERAICTTNDVVRTLLFHASLPENPSFDYMGATLRIMIFVFLVVCAIPTPLLHLVETSTSCHSLSFSRLPISSSWLSLPLSPSQWCHCLYSSIRWWYYSYCFHAFASLDNYF